tara:strand:- start:25929 stop:26654 length:726 start_codon:yes stop_codon:yes gene_type:complete
MKFLSYLLLTLSLLNTETNTKEEPFVLVQLFTSQGCSSCPPADKLIEKVNNEYKEQKVYVLSYHVDYWNRLGWADPFSKREFTEIQYKYADQFKRKQVYTPQIVVNGQDHFIGSNESKLRKKIKKYIKEAPENSITFSSSKNADGDTVLNYEVSGDIKNKNLKLAFVLQNCITKIKSGENSDKTLTNTNVVFKEVVLELNNQYRGSFTILKTSIEVQKELTIIGFIQNDALKVTGANKLDL